MFASYECDNQLYMTPRDFIKSLMHDDEDLVRFRSRHIVSSSTYERTLNSTPHLKEGSSHLFRDLGNDGFLSFFDYIFLVTILTKPKRSFFVAFKMFDSDNDGSITKEEYLQVFVRHLGHYDHQYNNTLLEWLVSKKEPNNTEGKHKNEKAIIYADLGVDKPTTLTKLFFGPKGDGELTIGAISKFIEDLQREMLDIEFQQLSNDTGFISGTELGCLLLRRFNVSPWKRNHCMTRLKESPYTDEKITFEEFEHCIVLLKNMDDFHSAVKMFLLGDRRITVDEFRRACRAVCGFPLSDSLIRVIFTLFADETGEHLDHKHFLYYSYHAVQRNIQDSPRLQLFKKCMRIEMK